MAERSGRKVGKESSLGKKHTCFSCGCRFYDLGRADAVCPRCKSNQKMARQEDLKAAARGSRRPVEIQEEEAETLADSGEELSYEEGDLSEDEFLEEDLGTEGEEIEDLENSLQEEESYDEDD